MELEQNKSDEDNVVETPQKGELTNAGLICADGSFIPRYKREPRKGLTDADEEVIAGWASDYVRRHPNVEIGLADMICLWAFKQPEECEEYVRANKEKQKNMTVQQRLEELKRDKFPHMHEYERVG